MLSQMRVLIVDDEKINRDLLVGLLKPSYRIMVANNGAKALQAAARLEGRPDLILLDIMMPDMDGYEVCQRLKEVDATRDIPIIFVTAMSEISDESMGFRLGAVDYITKPVSPSIVQARVKTHLLLKHNIDLLVHMASIDGLTEIPNRRTFDTALHKEWDRARRSGTSLAMLMMDVDLFKQYNDRYGHNSGDDCLKKLAGTLTKIIYRPGDMVARYGGEEFCALLSNTNLEGAQQVGERFRAGVEALNIAHAGSDVAACVTISVGAAAVLPDDKNSPQTLQLMADTRLYQAKAGGRNRVFA